jgi:hypothetical protein
MGLTMRERHAVVREISSHFRKASKKARSRILNEFVQLTGYNGSRYRDLRMKCANDAIVYVRTLRTVWG